MSTSSMRTGTAIVHVMRVNSRVMVLAIQASRMQSLRAKLPARAYLPTHLKVLLAGVSSVLSAPRLPTGDGVIVYRMMMLRLAGERSVQVTIAAPALSLAR